MNDNETTIEALKLRCADLIQKLDAAAARERILASEVRMLRGIIIQTHETLDDLMPKTRWMPGGPCWECYGTMLQIGGWEPDATRRYFECANCGAGLSVEDTQP